MITVTSLDDIIWVDHPDMEVRLTEADGSPCFGCYAVMAALSAVIAVVHGMCADPVCVPPGMFRTHMELFAARRGMLATFYTPLTPED